MKLRQLVIAALAVSGAATLAAANNMPQSQSSTAMPQAQSSQSLNAQPLGSNDVTEVQQALNDKGFNAGPVDGVAGPKTKSALKQFQQSQGLQASGQLDEQTLAALEGSGSPQASSSSQASNNSQSTSPFNPSDTTGQTSQASDRSMSSSPDISGSTSSVGSSQPPESQSQSQSSSTY